MKLEGRMVGVLAFGLVFLAATEGGRAAPLIETPIFADQVRSGKFPAVSERVPENPSTVDLKAVGKVPGRHGGTLRLLLGKQKDTKMMMVYGYARLIGYNKKFEFVPDILERFEVRDGREFTFHLRKGHRWSDGHPFTAEDFRYYWEDMAGNKAIFRKGLPRAMLVDGKGPKFEVMDETTIRYTWSKPNPNFIPWLSRPRPLLVYRPAHYLKQFHIKYGDKAKIAAMAKKAHKLDWAQLHREVDRWYRMDNPDRPTLQPWYNTVTPPSDRFVFRRNPYYHRIDANGRQLPYIDEVVINMGAAKMVPARTGSGETDLQARYLRFDHYTFLKETEKRYNMSVHLWRKARGAQIALFPNLNAKDPVWRKLLRDLRFRRALSLAIDRKEINQVIYHGLARPGNNTVLEESPLFKPVYRSAWTEFDLRRANSLLDEIGLTKRNDENLRVLSDGRPLIITVDTAGESTEQSDVLELIHDSWLAAGVKLFTKTSQREVFRKRIYAGETVMSIWSGISNGIPTKAMSPDEFAPTSRYQFQWPKWGLYGQTSGKSGEAPDMAVVNRLMSLNEAWPRSADPVVQTRIWHEMLQIHADNVFSIGIVNSTLQPVVVNNRLRNIPKDGVYNWHPGAYFGIYRPDSFWYTAK